MFTVQTWVSYCDSMTSVCDGCRVALSHDKRSARVVLPVVCPCVPSPWHTAGTGFHLAWLDSVGASSREGVHWPLRQGASVGAIKKVPRVKASGCHMGQGSSGKLWFFQGRAWHMAWLGPCTSHPRALSVVRQEHGSQGPDRSCQP